MKRWAAPALIALIGALLWLAPGSTPSRPEAVRAPIAPPELPQDPFPPAPAGAERCFDGVRPRDYFWAADEVRVRLKPGVRPEEVLPGARILEQGDDEFTAVIARGTKEDFAKEARRLQALPGVASVLPVYYPSESARDEREGPRLFLTRQVLVKLPPAADPVRVAARRDAALVRSLSYLPGSHVLEARETLGAFPLSNDLLAMEEAIVATPIFAAIPRLPVFRRATVNDPRFVNQWHLRNTVTVGEDVNAQAAWDVTFGAGVVVGIVDTGIEYTHPDLAANYNAAGAFDFINNDADSSPGSANENHGTAVAGVAAARGNNGVGVTGIAPLAQFSPTRLIVGAISTMQVADALTYETGIVHIKSNSWTFASDGALDDVDHAVDGAAINDAWHNGRGGRGTVFVFAAGNGGRTNPPAQGTAGYFDNVNYNGYATMRQVITVGSTTNLGDHSAYSSPGAAVLVCAPSNGGTLAIDTTDRTAGAGYAAGDYTGTGGTGFGGTSSSTPLVSGVVALMLSAEPQMSSRDVQHVLVRTARKNKNDTDPSWVMNQANRLVSHNFGHGVVDAGAAVALAKTMPSCGPEVSVTATSTGGVIAIPDSPAGTTPGAPVSKSVTLPAAGAIRVEHVEVVFNATHTRRGDLRVRLTHSGGAFDDLLADQRFQDAGDHYVNWQFMSTLHWGEMSNGTWTITVEDCNNGTTGSLGNFTLRVWGTAVDSSPPVAGTVRDGLAADIDFQLSTTTLSANWSGFSDPQSGLSYEWWIGTSPGASDVLGPAELGHATSATATGLSLVGGTAVYYVTVRATNFDGLQSSASSSNGVHLDQVAPTAPPTIGVSPNPSMTGAWTVSWTAGSDTGGAGLASYTLQRAMDGGAFADVSTGSLALSFIEPGLPAGSYVYRVRSVDGAFNVSGFTTSAQAIVDVTAPDTAIVTDPGNPSVLSLASFSYSSTEANSTFQYTIDGGAPISTGTTGSVTLSNLTSGLHTFTVRATDPAGNTDATPASFTWTVIYLLSDTVAPFVNSFDSPLSLSDWTVTANQAQPAWAVDASPSLVAGIGQAAFTGPSSLNYNNGVDLRSNMASDSGVATTPPMDRSALASGWIRFFCNNHTNPANDVLHFRVMSVDLTTIRSDSTMSATVAPPVAICSAPGVWHEHAIALNAAWTNAFRTQFLYSSTNAGAHPETGWFVDDFEVSDLVVGAIHQYAAGATAPIPVGGETTSGTIDFRGVSSIVWAGATQLEIEVQPLGTSFSGTATATGNGAGPGSLINVQIALPGLGAYHWRARTRGLPAGAFSQWMSFGANGNSDADFSMVTVPKKSKGGGGGCGATGMELLPLILLLRRVTNRRRRATNGA